MDGRDCADLRLLIQAEHDGEMDAAQAAGLAIHLDTCAACRALRDDLTALSADLRGAALRPPVPAALARRLAGRSASQLSRGASGQPDASRARRLLRRHAPAFAAGLALAASIALLLPRAGGDGADALAPLVAAHIRALQPGHLLDVPSTDQHTVKPWFAGKLDFAPPVRDFAAAGFPLVGGRLDDLTGRPVAALVYRHGRHLIDVFIWPETGPAEAPSLRVGSGYNVAAWRARGMAFRAVTDMDQAELRDFMALWRDSLAGA